jgi:hypothetical protein
VQNIDYICKSANFVAEQSAGSAWLIPAALPAAMAATILLRKDLRDKFSGMTSS